MDRKASAAAASAALSANRNVLLLLLQPLILLYRYCILRDYIMFKIQFSVPCPNWSKSNVNHLYRSNHLIAIASSFIAAKHNLGLSERVPPHRQEKVSDAKTVVASSRAEQILENGNSCRSSLIAAGPLLLSHLSKLILASSLGPFHKCVE